MVRMVCGQCRYSRDMSKREAEIGMLCPKCHCQYLRRPIKPRPGEGRAARPATIRAIVGGLFGLAVGAGLVALNLRYLSGPEAVAGTRLFALGIACLLAGAGSLITGLVLLILDLTQD